MEFNRLVNKIFEEFNPPYDAGRTPKVKPKGKYGTASPILNEPHDTKSISGFKGQPGGKVKTLKISLPKKKKKTKKPS
tara:strand:- start:173 stop:406 length:234 start_codon:yes stop_codon:yes gene_type:complete